MSQGEAGFDPERLHYGGHISQGTEMRATWSQVAPTSVLDVGPGSLWAGVVFPRHTHEASPIPALGSVRFTLPSEEVPVLNVASRGRFLFAVECAI